MKRFRAQAGRIKLTHHCLSAGDGEPGDIYPMTPQSRVMAALSRCC